MSKQDLELSGVIRQFQGKRILDSLFDAVRQNPKHPMNDATRAQGKHIAARIERAKAKRRNGRVVKGLRRKAGRATFSYG